MELILAQFGDFSLLGMYPCVCSTMFLSEPCAAVNGSSSGEQAAAVHFLLHFGIEIELLSRFFGVVTVP